MQLVTGSTLVTLRFLTFYMCQHGRVDLAIFVVRHYGGIHLGRKHFQYIHEVTDDVINKLDTRTLPRQPQDTPVKVFHKSDSSTSRGRGYRGCFDCYKGYRRGTSGYDNGRGGRFDSGGFNTNRGGRGGAGGYDNGRGSYNHFEGFRGEHSGYDGRRGAFDRFTNGRGRGDSYSDVVCDYRGNGYQGHRGSRN